FCCFRDLRFRSPSRRGSLFTSLRPSGQAFFSSSFRSFFYCFTEPTYECQATFRTVLTVEVSVSEGALTNTRVSPRQSEKTSCGGFFSGLLRESEVRAKRGCI